MQHLLKLLEVSRTKGVLITDHRNKKNIPMKPDVDFWRMVEKCQPFVFSKWTETKYNVDWKVPDHGTIVLEDMDAPFPVFSIETLDPKGLINLPATNENKAYRIDCILCDEIKPKEFGFFTLISFINEGQSTSQVVYKSNSEGEILKAYIERLSREQTGLKNVREAVKIGSSENKRVHRIKNIIYVCPKRDVADPLIFGSKQIDWTHRFMVRGHWRRLETGLGKDRGGNYCINGFTWVTEHERGPEELPLIHKTRMAK